MHSWNIFGARTSHGPKHHVQRLLKYYNDNEIDNHQGFITLYHPMWSKKKFKPT
jgi:hypothetical protein